MITIEFPFCRPGVNKEHDRQATMFSLNVGLSQWLFPDGHIVSPSGLLLRNWFYSRIFFPDRLQTVDLKPGFKAPRLAHVARPGHKHSPLYGYCPSQILRPVPLCGGAWFVPGYDNQRLRLLLPLVEPVSVECRGEHTVLPRMALEDAVVLLDWGWVIAPAFLGDYAVTVPVGEAAMYEKFLLAYAAYTANRPIVEAGQPRHLSYSALKRHGF